MGVGRREGVTPIGTNYYHRTEVCPHCGHAAEEVHIGKSSSGWTFSFHGTDQIRSWTDWKAHLAAGGEIRDEYGEVVSLEQFAALVERKRSAPSNHTTYCRASDTLWTREHGFRDCWLDEEGHSFSGGDFS
jgi:hypothetical protein